MNKITMKTSKGVTTLTVNGKSFQYKSLIEAWTFLKVHRYLEEKS